MQYNRRIGFIISDNQTLIGKDQSKRIIIIMYLIPLNEVTIYYNASYMDAASFATIYLLSVAYHPLFSNLLYLFYARTSGASYTNFNVMLRNTDTGQFLQNSTIAQNIQCLTGCDIQASQYLFLIESESYVAIYPVNIANYHVITNPVFTKDKASIGLSDITRQADIHKDKFVYTNTTHSIFGQLTSVSTTTTYFFPMNFHASNSLFIGLTDKWVYAAVNSSSVSLIVYGCVDCIFNGSLTGSNSSLSNLSNTLIIPTGISVSNSYRMYEGNQTINVGLLDSTIFWAIGDGISYKYLINQANYVMIENFTSYHGIFSSANNQYILKYGSNLNMNIRSFGYNSSVNYDQYQIYNFNYFLKGAAISNNSAIIALLTGENFWNVKQYQFVNQCNLYYANISTYSFFCNCYNYSGTLCAIPNTASNSSNPSKGESFPIGAIIGAVAGIIAIIVTIVLIKKYYKRCTKGRNRVPWKYNPVELMSYQI